MNFKWILGMMILVVALVIDLYERYSVQKNLEGYNAKVLLLLFFLILLALILFNLPLLCIIILMRNFNYGNSKQNR